VEAGFGAFIRSGEAAEVLEITATACHAVGLFVEQFRHFPVVVCGCSWVEGQLWFFCFMMFRADVSIIDLVSVHDIGVALVR
jgi:hypothetical protein